MTGAPPPGGDVAPAPDGDTPPTPPARLGASTFTIEGRAAPGLFVLAWIASILGIGLVVVGATLASAALGRAILLLGGMTLLSVGLVAGAGSQTIERRARGEAYAGPSPLLVFGAVYATVNVVLAPIGIVLEALAVPASGPVAAFLSLLVQVGIYIGLIRLLVVNTGALSWRDMGITGFGRDQLVDLAWGAMYAVPVIFITLVVASVLLSIFGTAPEAPLSPTTDPVGIVLNLVTGIVLAPVGEELLFRGFAATAWARSRGDRSAIARSGILFALAHIVTTRGSSFGEALAKAAVGFGTRLPVGIALGWIFLRRRSIYAAIGMHMGFNAILLVAGQLASQAGR